MVKSVKIVTKGVIVPNRPMEQDIGVDIESGTDPMELLSYMMAATHEVMAAYLQACNPQPIVNQQGIVIAQ